MTDGKEIELKIAKEGIAVLNDVRAILTRAEREISEKIASDPRYKNSFVRNIVFYIRDQIPKLVKVLDDEETAIRNWYHLWDDEGTGD